MAHSPGILAFIQYVLIGQNTFISGICYVFCHISNTQLFPFTASFYSKCNMALTFMKNTDCFWTKLHHYLVPNCSFKRYRAWRPYFQQCMQVFGVTRWGDGCQLAFRKWEQHQPCPLEQAFALSLSQSQAVGWDLRSRCPVVVSVPLRLFPHWPSNKM